MSQYCVENYWVAGYAQGDISSIAAAVTGATTASIGAANTLGTGYRTQATSDADVAAIRRIFQAFKAVGTGAGAVGAAITTSGAGSIPATSAQITGLSATYTRQASKIVAEGQLKVGSRLKYESVSEPSDTWSNVSEASDTWTNVSEGSASWTDKLLPHEQN